MNKVIENPPPSQESHAAAAPTQRANLKFLAEYLNLSPSTISFVLNDAPGRSIPPATRERVRAAARKFNYQPSLIARKLQGQRVKTVGVLLPELGEGRHARVMSGAGERFLEQDYFYFTAHHGNRADLLQAYPEILQARGVEGILAIDTHLETGSTLPTVLVGGQTALPGVSSVVLDRKLGAELALGHLHQLGHREIVYTRGQPFNPDTEPRWEATLAAARSLGLTVREELTIRLGQQDSPEVGCPGIERILSERHFFTAVVCFDDVWAMSAVRALHAGGLRVPDDVSVLGCDDILCASYHVPSLTTLRQPLRKMGSLAADILLKKLSNEPTPALLAVEPELIVRASTGPVRDN